MQSEGSNIAASTKRALEVIDRQIARVPELEKSLREEAQKVLLGLLQMRAEGLTLHEEIQKLDQRATTHRQQEYFVAARSIYSHIIDLYENERAKRGERTWYIKQDLPLAGTLDTMAEFLSELQQYQEAARYYWQALKICRKVYEDIINFDALALYDFAYGAVRQRNFPLAERYYHQALDYCLEHYAEDSALVARAQEEMGYFYMQSLQDFERAEKFLTEAAQTRMERFGEEHPLGAASLNMLAIVYLRQGRAGRAEQIRRRTRPVFQSLAQCIFLDTRPIEESMREISRLEIQLRIAKNSLPQFLKQREIILQQMQRLLDLQKTGILSLDMRRDIATSQDKWTEMLASSRPEADTQAEVVQESNEEPEEWDQNEEESERPVGAESLPTVQALLYREEHYEKAEELARRILRTCEKQYGEVNVTTATTLNSLAQACQKQEKYEEAVQCYQRVLRIYEELYSPEHMHATATLALLARCLIDMGNFDEGEEASQRLLALYTWQRRTEEPRAALPLLNLALIREKRGNHTEAESYYRRLLAIQERKWGAEHVALAGALSGLVRTCLRQRNYSEASAFYQRAADIAGAYLKNPAAPGREAIEKWQKELQQEYADLAQEMERG